MQVFLQGTLSAFDAPAEHRDKLVAAALRHGVHIGTCGETAVRFRPALIFGRKELEITATALKKALKGLASS